MSLNVEYAAVAKCRPDHVWQVFEKIELWSRWDPEAISDVRWVSGEPWTQGARFTISLLKPLPFKLTPEVLEIDSPIYVHLRGEGSGVTGDQHYIFKWMPDQQSTELRTLQEFSGGPIMFLGNAIKPGIEAGIKHLFTRIIEEAEGLARAEVFAIPGPHLFPPIGDPMPPATDPQPPVDDPIPPPLDPIPRGGDPAPPVRDPEPPFHE
jgi:hypothetical protein